MLNRLQFNRVRTLFIFWFVFAATAPLVLFGVAAHMQRARAFKEDAFEKLVAIRDLKIDQLNKWLKERENDIQAFAQNRQLRDFGETFADRPGSPDVAAKREDARRVFHDYHNHYEACAELMMLDAATGRIILSTAPDHEGYEKANDPYFTETLRLKTTYIKDVYYSAFSRQPMMASSAPLFSLTEPGRIIGVLVKKIDLTKSLFPLLLNRTGMGATGETLIVNNRGMALNALRHHPDAPLKLKITARPAALAARGKSGVIEAMDYRGAPVLAAYAHVSTPGWGFVSKQDLKEVYAPIDAMFRQGMVLLICVVVVVYAFAVMLANTIASPVTHMSDVCEQISAGDFSVRCRVKRKDEFGKLAATLNEMAASLSSRMTVEKETAEISRIMVTTDNPDDFYQAVLDYLIRMTDSCIGVWHLLDPAEKTFKPAFSVGAVRAALRSFSAETHEGEIGHAVRRREVVSRADIPDDAFIFKTAAGDAAPKAMIAIPVMADEQVAAVISLAALKPYAREQLEVIRQNWAGLSAKFANLRAADTIRTLADEMQRKNQELQIQSQELKRQSETLQRQNIELERQSRQIQEADRLKSEFLSNMSHELRTPLNSIIALSRVLMLQTRETLSDAEFGYLEIIGRNGRQLLDLINDILDLSKIEAGRIDVMPETFSLKQVVENLKESLDPLAADKGIDIRARIPDDVPDITSDMGKVRQILQNIVGNAVKFTEKGRVDVSARQDGDGIAVTVADTGIGIPAEALPHVFEAFRQVDGSMARRFEGTGLGLAIAQRHARLLGGDIQVESAPGKGSVFTLLLPTVFRGAPGRGAGPEGRLDAPPAATAGAGDRPRLLVVEDSEPAIVQVRHVLERNGYHVDAARSGEEALAVIRKTTPDGVILDLMMPGMDGFEVLNRIRRFGPARRVPVLVLTARDLTPEDLGRLSANHIQQLIQKGDVDQEQLLFKIKLMLGSVPKSPPAADAPDAPVMETPDAIVAAPVRAAEAPEKTEDKPLILLIEDNPDNLATLKAVLGGRYALRGAGNAEEGLKKLLERPPALVLMDMSLPGMTGFEAAARIKADERTKDIPVIAVTAHAMKGDREKALKAGCNGYVSKPVDPERLLAYIYRFLRSEEKRGTEEEETRKHDENSGH